MTEPLLAKQASSSLIDQPEPDVSGLIDLLTNRVCEKNLNRAAPVASDVPERTVRHIPALSPETGAEWPGRWPGASRLLTHPEAIDTVALLPVLGFPRTALLFREGDGDMLAAALNARFSTSAPGNARSKPARNR